MKITLMGVLVIVGACVLALYIGQQIERKRLSDNPSGKPATNNEPNGPDFLQ